MDLEVKILFNDLTAEEFIGLSKSVGWGVDRSYNLNKVKQALKDTSFIVAAKVEGNVIGCARAFSDDLLMTFIPDIFVRPEYQKKGIGKTLVEEIKKKYGHTNIFFGSRPGNEGFFDSLGFEKSLQSFAGKFSENPYFS